MGGFSGRLGTAVGYMWNGKWCLRSRPAQVANPRTPAQVEHRTLFREEVRLAARMGRGVATGLTAMARQMGITCFNLFVSVNQQAFGLEDGTLRVDYGALAVSLGPVAPVAFGKVEVDGDNVLRINYEKNPMHVVANGYDRVTVYAYCPDMGGGIMSAPAYRRDKRLAFALPDEYVGREVHLYGMVQDDEGRCSESVYLGTVPVQGVENELAVGLVEADGGYVDPLTGEWTAAAGAAEGAAAVRETPPAPPDKGGRSTDETYSTDTLKNVL